MKEVRRTALTLLRANSVAFTGGTIYRAHFAPTLNLAFKIATKFSPFQKKKHILDADSITDAIRGCDTYATQKILEGPIAKGYDVFATWRVQGADVFQSTT